ncbi:3TM-type holin [Aliamphritea spongicola]|nr:hypothetical protein [Aliamphritea spongicola]
MSIWNILGELVRPVSTLIDEIHTSEDERLQIKASLFEMQTHLATQVMAYEAQLLKAKTSVITAEAQGPAGYSATGAPSQC